MLDQASTYITNGTEAATSASVSVAEVLDGLDSYVPPEITQRVRATVDRVVLQAVLHVATDRKPVFVRVYAHFGDGYWLR